MQLPSKLLVTPPGDHDPDYESLAYIIQSITLISATYLSDYNNCAGAIECFDCHFLIFFKASQLPPNSPMQIPIWYTIKKMVHGSHCAMETFLIEKV